MLLEFSMTPSTKEKSKSPYVARILDVIDRGGLPCQLTPMDTIIEGNWAAVMAVVTDCFKALEVDCPRIGSQITTKKTWRVPPSIGLITAPS